MIRRLLLVLSVFGPILSIPSNRGSQAESSDSYCYLSDDEPYLFFSSETAYDYTHGDISEDEVPESKQKSAMQRMSCNCFLQLAPLFSFGL